MYSKVVNISQLVQACFHVHVKTTLLHTILLYKGEF